MPPCYTVGTSQGQEAHMISLVITLIIVGVLLWAINSFIPMAGSIKSILNVVVIICVLLYVLSAFGIVTGIRVPRIR